MQLLCVWIEQYRKISQQMLSLCDGFSIKIEDIASSSNESETKNNLPRKRVFLPDVPPDHTTTSAIKSISLLIRKKCRWQKLPDGMYNFNEWCFLLRILRL